MPGIFAVTLETPALAAPTGWSGLIMEVTTAEITRELNRAGSFRIVFPATAHQADQIKAGWRVTLIQERLASGTTPGTQQIPLLYRGKVLNRQLIFDASGQALLDLTGETYLGQLADTWIHTGQTFTAQDLPTIASALLTPLGLGYNAPARCTGKPLTITFNDTSVLQALIKLAEAARCDIADGSFDVLLFLDQQDRPVPHNSLTGNALTLIQVEQAGPDLAQAALDDFGIIAGLPQATYDAMQLANKIVAIGVEYDGSPLTLENAVYYDSKYVVQSAAGPSGNYFYVSDSGSVTDHGTTELQIVRTDVKNPSNNPTTRAQAKAALLALASGELLQRRSEILTFSCEIANGEDIYALPGERVYVRFKGFAVLPDGNITWLNLDQNMLVFRRNEVASPAGVRLVSLCLVSPTIPYTLPNNPTAVVIPSPKNTQVADMPTDPTGGPTKPGDPTDPTPPGPDAAADAIADAVAAAVGAAKHFGNNNGAYQPCCADQTTDTNAGVTGPSAGLGLADIADATHGGDNGGGVTGGHTLTTPPAGVNTVKRAYFVMGQKITGMTCSGGLIYNSVFTNGPFSVWMAESPIGGADSGLVTVSHSASDGGSEAWRIDVGTSTAPIPMLVGQDLNGLNTRLNVLDNGGLVRVINDVGSHPLTGSATPNSISVTP